MGIYNRWWRLVVTAGRALGDSLLQTVTAEAGAHALVMATFAPWSMFIPANASRRSIVPAMFEARDLGDC
jgi:hypothetical protein